MREQLFFLLLLLRFLLEGIRLFCARHFPPNAFKEERRMVVVAVPSLSLSSLQNVQIYFFITVFSHLHTAHTWTRCVFCVSQSLFPLEELTTALFNFDLLLDFASIKHAGLLLQLIEDSRGWRAGGYFLFIIVLLLPPPPPLFRESGAKGRTNKFLRLRLDWAKER